ncbi:M1 family metallopeptidase [Brevibacillus borstelensis]|uniref:M1 family metallopeptidase n=1 Tax=Brevibacillus borstelensis TaxID=45462 RepID=UPI0004F25F11|nr:M1 family metallopeptidase [Brevibacillus borstelensis]KKX56045.1 aminopeptidase N [Brevibacillus borstelensis cifa_chp40]MED2008240.1 M1 family metallopeptidase [Brevibacillus borstelensis]
MRRKGWMLLAAAGAGLTALLLAQPWKDQARADTVKPEQIPAHTTYTGDVRIDPKNHTVSGKLSVRFFSTDSQAMFHLYPNAFHPQADLSDPNWQQILGKQTEPGRMRIMDVRADGKTAAFRTAGPTENILQVALPETLQTNGGQTNEKRLTNEEQQSNEEQTNARQTSDKQITQEQVNPNQSDVRSAGTVQSGKQTSRLREVEIEFQLKLPRNNGRLSYNGHAMWLGNWLPMLAVREKGEWRLDPYYPMGDPFYSEMAHYHLKVHLPEGYLLATSGTESQAVVTRKRPQKEAAYEIDAWNIRDFALVVMDDSYRQTTSQVNGTTIRTWWQEGDDPETVARLHETAAESIRYFGQQFGRYPYSEYDVVKTGGFFGGMEYPGISFIQGDFFVSQYGPNGMGTAVVAHETAHQWFYGLVGSDEIREAWVDESLADYATMAFLEDGPVSGGGSYLAYRRERARQSDAYAKQGLDVWLPLDRFPDWKSYSDLVYARGGMMWWTLRSEWGKDRLHQMLREYVQNHQYSQATGGELVKMLSEAAGENAAPFVDYWLRLDLEKKSEADAWMKRGRLSRMF